jgi:hypothetical protein
LDLPLSLNMVTLDQVILINLLLQIKYRLFANLLKLTTFVL